MVTSSYRRMLDFTRPVGPTTALTYLALRIRIADGRYMAIPGADCLCEIRYKKLRRCAGPGDAGFIRRETSPVSALCWRPRPIKPVGRHCGRSLLAKRPVTRFSAGSAGKNRLANIDHSQFVDLRRLVRHGKCYGHRCATQLFHWADPAGGGWRSLLGPLRRSATRYVGPPRCSGPSGAVRLVQRPFCVFRGRPRSRSK